MAASLLLSWRPGVSAAWDTERATLRVQGPTGRTVLRQLPAAVREAIRQCEPPGQDEESLAELVQNAGQGMLAKWYYCLGRLSQRGFMCHGAHADGRRLATASAISSSFLPCPGEVVAGRAYVVSRFAYLRREGDQAVLESPLAHARVVLDDCQTAAVVAALAVPSTADELARRVSGFSVEAVAAVMKLLLRVGMLDEACTDSDGCLEEETVLQTWSFHDLLFHARSRKGRFDAPYGGTYRHAGKLAPPPAFDPCGMEHTHVLYRPDISSLEQHDPPLAWVQERRRSLREYSAQQPLSLRQLGEFLFRIGRVKEQREMEIPTLRGPVRMEFAHRPYPAGGALYELDLYVVVNRCDGLDGGLYRYEPVRHALNRVRAQTPEVAALLQDAADSAAIPAQTLQVLIVLASRFARLAWKYESIAYALTLKHVGVLYQTMYLAATAMGLAPCALGGGDADLFARAAGTDYYAQSSVGEFLLGSVRPE